MGWWGVLRLSLDASVAVIVLFLMLQCNNPVSQLFSAGVLMLLLSNG